jgi:hypothetical protein
MTIIYQANEDNMMKKIKHKNKTLTIIQQAHCEVALESDYHYQAHAIDTVGNEYLATWTMYDCYQDGTSILDDESQACDWDDYKIIEI